MHSPRLSAPTVNPQTGLTALGFRRDGRPIWPVLGGSQPAGEPTSVTPPVPVPTPPIPAPVPAPVVTPAPSPGEDGQTFSSEEEKWKYFARKHEAAARANADKAKQYDELQQAQMTETQKQQVALELATKAATEANEALWRERAARHNGLSDEDLQWITGATEAEIQQKAAAFAARVNAGATSPTPPPPAPLPQGARGGANTAPSVAAGADLYAERQKKKPSYKEQ